MKLKKLVSAVVCAAMACVFAVSAFAAAPEAITARRNEAVQYLKEKGYPSLASAVSQMDDSIIENLIDNGPEKSILEGSFVSYAYAIENATSVDEARKHVEAAAAQLAEYGINVTVDSVELVNGQIVVKASVAGIAVAETLGEVAATGTAAKDEHPDIAANKDENGNWHVDETTTSAAAAVTSGTAASGVIKATGDNSAVVLVAGVLVVAAVLGLAVRKNSNVG